MDSEPVLPQPEPIIPPPTPPARKFSPILISAAVILLVVVGTGGLILGKSLNTFQKSAQPTVIPLPTQIPTPTPDIADLQRKTDLNIIRPALEIFRAEQGRYPNTLKELVPEYMVVMSVDPAIGAEYYYQVSQTKLDYSLSARLDDGTTYAVSAPK